MEQAADGLGKFFLRGGRLAEGLEAYSKASVTIQNAEQAGQPLHNHLLARLLISHAGGAQFLHDLWYDTIGRRLPGRLVRLRGYGKRMHFHVAVPFWTSKLPQPYPR